MMVKLVIFDLDGTIIKLPIDWARIREELREISGVSFKFKPLLPSINEVGRRDSKLREKMLEVLEREEIKAVDSINVGESKLRSFFKELLNRGVKVSLVTLQSRVAAERALTKLNILDFFESIVSRDESSSRVEQIELTLKKLSVSATQSIVIGDTETDLCLAKRLGCKAIRVEKPLIDDPATLNTLLSIIEKHFNH